MNNDEIVIRKWVVNKVLQVVQQCVDESRKGWRVKIREFNDAMDDLGFTGEEVRAALAYLRARMYVITLLNSDGSVTGISLVPQWYPCEFCKMPLYIQDDPEGHIDLCLRRQAKIKRNRKLA
jgi:hypothetical protein